MKRSIFYGVVGFTVSAAAYACGGGEFGDGNELFGPSGGASGQAGSGGGGASGSSVTAGSGGSGGKGGSAGKAGGAGKGGKGGSGGKNPIGGFGGKTGGASPGGAAGEAGDGGAGGDAASGSGGTDVTGGTGGNAGSDAGTGGSSGESGTGGAAQAGTGGDAGTGNAAGTSAGTGGSSGSDAGNGGSLPGGQGGTSGSGGANSGAGGSGGNGGDGGSGGQVDPHPIGCADDSVEQVYGPEMHGCDGSSNQCGAKDLCTETWHLCTTDEYIVNGGGGTLPDPSDSKRWLAGCLREGGAIHAPTPQVCSECITGETNKQDVAWKCDGSFGDDDSNNWIGILARGDLQMKIGDQNQTCAYTRQYAAWGQAGAVCCRQWPMF